MSNLLNANRWCDNNFSHCFHFMLLSILFLFEMYATDSIHSIHIHINTLFPCNVFVSPELFSGKMNLRAQWTMYGKHRDVAFNQCRTVSICSSANISQCLRKSTVSSSKTICNLPANWLIEHLIWSFYFPFFNLDCLLYICTSRTVSYKRIECMHRHELFKQKYQSYILISIRFFNWSIETESDL